MPRVIFRSTFNRVLSIVTWLALGLLAIGTLLTPGASTAAPGIVLGAASASALVWAVVWAPQVAIDDDGVAVANVLITYAVPWAALVHVETRYALVLHTPGRRIAATAAPAPGAAGSLRATRAQRRDGAPTAAGIRPGDLPTTDSGRAAELVRARWHHLRDNGRIEAGTADTTTVRVRPRVGAIVVIVLAVSCLVAAILLG